MADTPIARRAFMMIGASLLLAMGSMASGFEWRSFGTEPGELPLSIFLGLNALTFVLAGQVTKRNPFLAFNVAFPASIACLFVGGAPFFLDYPEGSEAARGGITGEHVWALALFAQGLVGFAPSLAMIIFRKPGLAQGSGMSVDEAAEAFSGIDEDDPPTFSMLTPFGYALLTPAAMVAFCVGAAGVTLLIDRQFDEIILPASQYLADYAEIFSDDAIIILIVFGSMAYFAAGWDTDSLREAPLRKTLKIGHSSFKTVHC
ncbi:hypothetical protein [Parvularcula lutaonensis]|uniref:Integral membrane protein n=1 Tax=Parvularcula lutaonensis TaxID=491923 RepID=A0ABV7M8J5_9PROT|nr:hypothetical protein [Parvularcula lutaonensis]GGY41201.1 hypothetical protein GCM10007148_07230 [Parvularcula lutaonensis]